MTILDRIRETLTDLSEPLTREDAPKWAAAQSLPELAELTAQWLEGRIDSQPGYYGPVDVDEADAPGLTAALIACNRAGYLTNGSQAGCLDEVTETGRWTQLAAVTGFAPYRQAQRLAGLVVADGRFRIEHGPMEAGGNGVTVTWRDGHPYTRFGGRLSRRTMRDELYGGCSRQALKDVAWSQQVTIYDPVAGRNDLWEWLHTTVGQV
jgi:hypothetical protein